LEGCSALFWQAPSKNRSYPSSMCALPKQQHSEQTHTIC